MKVSRIYLIILCLVVLFDTIHSIHIFKLMEDKLAGRIRFPKTTHFPLSFMFPDTRSFITSRKSRSIVSNLKDLILNNPISQAFNSLLPARSRNRGARNENNYVKNNFPDYNSVYEFSPEYIQFQPSQNIYHQPKDSSYVDESAVFYDDSNSYTEPKSGSMLSDIETYGSPAAPIINNIDTYGSPAAPLISHSSQATSQPETYKPGQESDIDSYGIPTGEILYSPDIHQESVNSYSSEVHEIDTYGTPSGEIITASGSGYVSFPVSESIDVYDPAKDNKSNENLVETVDYNHQTSQILTSSATVQPFNFNNAQTDNYQVQIIKDYYENSTEKNSDVAPTEYNMEELNLVPVESIVDNNPTDEYAPETQILLFPDDIDDTFTKKSLQQILETPIFREEAFQIMNINNAHHPLVYYL